MSHDTGFSHKEKVEPRLRNRRRGFLFGAREAKPRSGTMPFRLLAAFSVLVSIVSPAASQTAPDAGSLQRETTRTIPVQPTPPMPAPLTPMKPEDKGLQVRVNTFHFDLECGDLLPKSDFRPFISDLIGKPVTLGQLEQAARRVEAYYRSYGFLVRAYLPEQEIRHGTVRIVVIESRLGDMIVEKRGKRADAELVKKMVGRSLKAGAPIPYFQLERGLLLANDLPGLQATGILEPGKRTGETDLRISVEDRPLVDGEVAANNDGFRATGGFQGAAGMNVNFGDGSRLGLNALGSEGLRYAAVDYARPLGSDGWRFLLNASGLYYELGREFEALDARGSAGSFGAGVRYPLIRSEKTNLYFDGDAVYRLYKDESLGIVFRRKNVEALTLGMCADWGNGSGSGRTQSCLAAVGGNLDLRGDDLAADQAGPQAADAFFKVRGHAVRWQGLGRGFSLTTRLSGQWAGKNLDSSEKFALGGPYGVRAYPVNEAAGDTGLVATLELGEAFGNGLGAAVFFDHGEVWRAREPWPEAAQPNHYGLSGAGFEINFLYSDAWSLRLSVAHPVGGNNGSADPDKNQDGSRRGTRGWAGSVIRF